MQQTQYKVKQLTVEDKEDFDKFIESLLVRYPHMDVFEAVEPISIKKHTHKDYEARLFVSGYASFNINETIVECAPGSYIEIESDVPHSFEYSGGEPLKVLRFFSNDDSWHAFYIP